MMLRRLMIAGAAPVTWNSVIASLPGLWGHWKLDETAGAAVVAADSSGNGRDGNYTASGTQAAGLIGGSVTSQATIGGRIDVPNWTTPSTPKFTIGAVVKTTHAAGSEQQIFSADISGNRVFQFYKNITTNALGVTILTPSIVAITAATAINNGNPRLVIAVYDESLSAAAGRIKIYLDGVQDGQSTTAITLSAGVSANLGIGARSGAANSGLWAGAIDEGFFCNDAISAAQVSALWAARNS